MKLFAVLLVIGASGLAAPAFALASNEAPAAAPAKPTKLSLPAAKDKVLERIKDGLPDVFCSEKAYFRKCFDTTAEACRKATTTAISACITELDKEIPAQIATGKEGQTLGDKLGSCTGARVEAALPKSKAASADCNDPNRWK